MLITYTKFKGITLRGALRKDGKEECYISYQAKNRTIHGEVKIVAGLNDYVLVKGHLRPFSIEGILPSNSLDIKISIHIEKDVLKKIKRVKEIESNIFRYFNRAKLQLECKIERTSEPRYGVVSVNSDTIPKEIQLNLSRSGDYLIGKLEDSRIYAVFEMNDGSTERVEVLGIPQQLFFTYELKPTVADKFENIYDYLQFEFDLTGRKILELSPVEDNVVALIISSKAPNRNILDLITDVKLIFDEMQKTAEIRRSSNRISCKFNLGKWSSKNTTFNPSIMLTLRNNFSNSLNYMVKVLEKPFPVKISTPPMRIEIAPSAIDVSKDRRMEISFGDESFTIEPTLKEYEEFIEEKILSRIFLETQGKKIGWAIRREDVLSVGKELSSFFFKGNTSLYKLLQDSKIKEVWIRGTKNEYLYPFEIFADKDNLWGLKYTISTEISRRSRDPPIFFGKQLILKPPIKVLIIVSQIVIDPRKKSQRYYDTLEEEKNNIISTLGQFKINNEPLFEITVLEIRKDNIAFKNNRRVTGPGFQKDNLSEVREEIRKNYGIIHFIGESKIFDIPNKKKTIAFLVDENINDIDVQLEASALGDLLLEEATNFSHKVGLVFANFCNAIYYKPASRLFGKVFDLEYSFNKSVAHRVGCFIGPFVYIPTSIAKNISKEFYTELFSPIKAGKFYTLPVAEAMRRAKVKLHNSPQKDISYLFFSVLGRPDFRFVIER